MNLHERLNELHARRNELSKRTKAIDSIFLLVGLLMEKVKEVEELEAIGLTELFEK
jgi:hypothetical protein